MKPTPKRVLLDENLPRKLKWHLDPALVTEVLTVPERGWGGMKNGALLVLAAAEFDVLVTMDKGVRYQQNLLGLDLCLVPLHAVSNDLDDLLPLVPELNAKLGECAPGRVLVVGRVPGGA